tara:strand:- start:946 stop:1593 length:648 start_codon:yes stop_codon:yes gene_type:complete
MPKYKIIDNFLDPDYYQLIVSHFLGDVDTPNVQWNYERDMSGHQHSNITKYTGKEEPVGISYQGFSHPIWQANHQYSPYYRVLLPMIEKIMRLLENTYCYRIMSFMTLQTGSKRNFSHHIDMPGIKHNTAVFYLNDSDGDTCLYKEEKPLDSMERVSLDSLTLAERVQPKANRLLLFQGNQWHSSESPVVSPRRVIFNMNFGDTNIVNHDYYDNT